MENGDRALAFCLSIELPTVTFFRSSHSLFKDQLANSHAWKKANLERPVVTDFQLNRAFESGVYYRGSNVDANA